MKQNYWTNQKVAELLKSISAAYEVKNESKFKIMAYDRAATSVEHLTSEIKDLWDENKLGEIPGVGGSISSHLNELFSTGKSSHFDKILKDLPPAMFEMIKIPGIGPKTAFKLCQELNIWKKNDALKRLEKAAKNKQIRSLEGFGEESEKNILRSLQEALIKKKTKERMLLSFAYEKARQITNYLKKSQYVLDAECLGSLRRRNSTIGDIDIAIKTNEPEKALKHFLKYKKIYKINSRGDKKASVILKDQVQVDVRTQTPDMWGSMLQYFTGSKQHNIKLREIALKKNLSLSEYGIKDKASGKIQKTPTEKLFYKKLGLQYIPPEIREGENEIELANQHKLRKLVETKDIRGDLHIHSNFPIEPSHDLGKNTMIECIQKAQKRNYEYIGFAEHNPAISKHSPKEIKAILNAKKDYIDKINNSSSKNLNIKVLNGLEIDIKPNGSLAIGNNLLDLLDYAIVSIHTSLNLSRKKMTDRILAGLSHPKALVLGHPTCRKLNEREGIRVDWDRVFTYCRNENKILEINAYPDRLDLPDFLVKEALSYGIKFIINTDAHSAEDLKLIKYGVFVARRGWAGKNDIINTYKLKDFLKIINC